MPARQEQWDGTRRPNIHPSARPFIEICLFVLISLDSGRPYTYICAVIKSSSCPVFLGDSMTPSLRWLLSVFYDLVRVAVQMHKCSVGVTSTICQTQTQNLRFVVVLPDHKSVGSHVSQVQRKYHRPFNTSCQQHQKCHPQTQIKPIDQQCHHLHPLCSLIPTVTQKRQNWRVQVWITGENISVMIMLWWWFLSWW